MCVVGILCLQLSSLKLDTYRQKLGRAQATLPATDESVPRSEINEWRQGNYKVVATDITGVTKSGETRSFAHSR